MRDQALKEKEYVLGATSLAPFREFIDADSPQDNELCRVLHAQIIEQSGAVRSAATPYL